MIALRLIINHILVGIILFEHMPMEDKYFLEAIFNTSLNLHGCLDDVRFCKSEDNKTHILIEYDSSDRGYYDEEEIQPSLFEDTGIPNNNLKEIMLPEYAAFVWSIGKVFCPKDIYTDVYEYVSHNYPYEYEYIVNHK